MVMFPNRHSIELLALSAIASLSISLPAIANQRNEVPVPAPTVAREIVAISETKRSLIFQMLEITGGKDLKGAEVDSFTDHRIAMSLAIAALNAKGKTTIHRAEAASISYPNFVNTLIQVLE